MKRAGRKRRAYQTLGGFRQEKKHQDWFLFWDPRKESLKCVGYFRINISMMAEKCPLDLEVKKLLVTLFRGLSVG